MNGLETSEIFVREMEPGDVDNGLLESLDALRPASRMDRIRARRICEKISADSDHLVAVAVLREQIVGTASLLIEHKIIHDGGLAGHIEDVAVATDFQGYCIGTALIKYLLNMAKERGCYRTTLDCQESLIGFYSRMGLEPGGVSMRIYHR